MPKKRRIVFPHSPPLEPIGAQVIWLQKRDHLDENDLRLTDPVSSTSRRWRIVGDPPDMPKMGSNSAQNTAKPKIFFLLFLGLFIKSSVFWCFNYSKIAN